MGNNIKRQVKLSEKRIDETINDVLSKHLKKRVNETLEDTPEWYSEFMKPEYSRKPDETPDYNENVLDFNTGRYATLSQMDDDWANVLGQTKRPTMRGSMDAIERYYNDKLDNIVREAIEKYTYQDTEDEDSDIWDTELENDAMYRVKWCIKRYDYLNHGYETVSEESVECEGEQEARKLYKDVIENYKGCYALYVTIEKEIDTLTGKRWERVLHMDGKTL